MGESGYFPFHIRLKLAKMFESWADEHKVEKCAENVIAYLVVNDLLSYREIRDFLNAAKNGAEKGRWRRVSEKLILDCTCGSRSIWFEKNEPHTLYCDRRQERFEGDFGTVKAHRTIHIEPDMIGHDCG